LSRRPDRTALALVVPILALIAFGMVRAGAPASAIGLVFDSPLAFGIFAAITAVAGAVLLFIRPVELVVARLLAGQSRPPTAEESERLTLMLEKAGERGGIDPARLIVNIQDDPGVNASAGASHLLFVTSGALSLPDDQLEAVLAHELGHHRGMHPVLSTVVWWLRIPGAILSGVYGLLRRAVAATGNRFGSLGRLIALPIMVLLVIWQITVMWLFYIEELLTARAARISEFGADHAAARWGYGEPLAETLEELSRREAEPSGRVGRLMADHPPLSARIERLRDS
jgi:Zn-dependent protease with chaperone function